jgi:hypothetical protein
MSPDWKTGTPPECGYYLVTEARGVGDGYTSFAWYNPTNGWWSQRPGHNRSENINHRVTHWAERPEAAEPTEEDLASLPTRRWVPWYDHALQEIADHLIFDRRERAIEALDQLRARISTEL